MPQLAQVWLCLTHFALDTLGRPPELALFRRIALRTPPGPPQIGFVLHNRPRVPAGARNWLRLYDRPPVARRPKLALCYTSHLRLQTSLNWLCSAPQTSHFKPETSSQLGLFVQPALGRQPAGGLPPQACPPIRRPTTPPKADTACPVPFRKSAIETPPRWPASGNWLRLPSHKS
jgi:hypothetical protein